jgi:hypothetical protein
VEAPPLLPSEGASDSSWCFLAIRKVPISAKSPLPCRFAHERTRRAAAATRLRSGEKRLGAGEEHERRRAGSTRARESGGRDVSWNGRPARCERASRLAVECENAPGRRYALAQCSTTNVRAPANSPSGAARVTLHAHGSRTGAGEEHERRRAGLPACRPIETAQEKGEDRKCPGRWYHHAPI